MEFETNLTVDLRVEEGLLEEGKPERREKRDDAFGLQPHVVEVSKGAAPGLARRGIHDSREVTASKNPCLCYQQSGSREVEGEEEYLEILGITREQSGKYECKAANEVSSADVKQVKVTVNYPPTITESKSNEATTGRQASLKCEASAVPAPDFEWYRDDTRINSANGLEIKSTEGQSSLTVTNVTEEHYGNYTCVAANKLGVTNASLVLFKRVLPTIPHPIQEIGTTVHFKQKGPGSVRGINGSISLAVPLWLLAASLLCLLSKC
nr:limbic system-associated membrane protein [Cavia porcellus]